MNFCLGGKKSLFLSIFAIVFSNITVKFGMKTVNKVANYKKIK